MKNLILNMAIIIPFLLKVFFTHLSIQTIKTSKYFNSYISHRIGSSQLSADIKMKNYKIKTSFLGPAPHGRRF